MIKFVSELRLKPVLSRQEKAIVGIVEDLVLSPDTGKLVGIMVREGFGKKHLKALPEKDLLTITSEFYLITSYEALGDIEEIIRVKEIVDRDITIVGNRVVTVSGKHLGKCRDYTLNMKTLTLEKIYVTSTLLTAPIKEYVIAFNQIVSIEKDKITVEDASIKLKEPAKGRLADASN